MNINPINHSIFERLDQADELGQTEERNSRVEFGSQRSIERPHEVELQASVLQSTQPVGAFSGNSLDGQEFQSRLPINDRTQTFAVSAADLASSAVDLESRISEWGFNEGIGSGTLPDGFNSCGCGQCPSCQGNDLNNFGNPNAATTILNLDQVVFLDFDSGTNGNIDYTQEIRDQVQFRMELVYQNFGVTFVQSMPTSGDFSTLVFNAGGSGGLAEDIDFRNLNKNDNAVINIVGFGLTNTEEQIISASANIGAHELGHILGLRHHDAFGAIGTGIPDGLFFPGFSPPFPGPEEAVETRWHIMNTPALAGDVTDVLTRNWFSEREAIKLAFAVNGSVLVESLSNNDTFQQAQVIELSELVVPNTIIEGENADSGDFLVDAVSVVGSFTFVDPVDYYSFEGKAGLAYSFEVISNATGRYSDIDPIDPIISVFDSDFNILAHFGGTATNDDDVEFSLDSHLFDLFLPGDGTYFVEVETFSSGDAGNYELFIQGFVATPFGLPEFDDHTDNLSLTEADQLVFEPVSDIVIARANGVVGFVDNPGERDVFSFTIDSNARAIINVTAQTDFFDTFVQVFDSNGNLVGFNDNHTNPSLQNALDSQLIIPNLGPGDYFVAVSGTNGSTGEYRLGVRHNGAAGNPDDHGDSFSLASTVNLLPLPNSTFINASAELGTDVDVFRFTAIATGRIVVRSRALSGDLNTVLRGYAADRTLLDANNNFNGTLDSRIGFNTIAGESYFVRLNTVHDTAGDYRLSLRSIPGESTPASFNPNGLTLGNQGGSPGSSYDKYVNLNFNNDTGAAFDDFIASSDINFGRIDDHDPSANNGILTGNA